MCTCTYTHTRMRKTKKFDKEQARAYAMQYGLVVGVVCLASFLCTMYAGNSLLMAQTGNLLGLFAVMTAGTQIRMYRAQVARLNFRQAWYMAIFIYLFAIIVTALGQYLYFALLDNGTLREQILTMLETPEYQKLLAQLTGTTDTDEILRSTADLMQSPTQMTVQLMWMNVLLALLLSVPTVLIGITGERKGSS